MFLKFFDAGYMGDSLDTSHPDEIEVVSWAWGQSNSGTVATTASGGGAGRGIIGDFTFTMRVCRAYPNLSRACSMGTSVTRMVTVPLRSP